MNRPGSVTVQQMCRSIESSARMASHSRTSASAADHVRVMSLPWVQAQQRQQPRGQRRQRAARGVERRPHGAGRRLQPSAASRPCSSSSSATRAATGCRGRDGQPRGGDAQGQRQPVAQRRQAGPPAPARRAVARCRRCARAGRSRFVVAEHVDVQQLGVGVGDSPSSRRRRVTSTQQPEPASSHGISSSEPARVVQHDDHATVRDQACGQRRPLVHGRRHLTRGHAKGAQEPPQHLVGVSGSRLRVVAVQVDVQLAVGEVAAPRGAPSARPTPSCRRRPAR